LKKIGASSHTSNMTVPTFSMAERDRRWSETRKFMEMQNVDALLIFGEHEDAGPAPFAFDIWFTNGRPGTTVVFPKVGDPVSLFPMSLFSMDHMESCRRGDVMWIPAENIRNSRDSSTLAAVLNETGLAKGTIGVVGLEPYPPWHMEGILPYTLWNNILKQFPYAHFKPVAHALARLVMPQSQEETAVVRHTASIGDAMARAMVETAGPGVSESEVYAAGMAAGFSRGAVPSPMHFWSGPEPVASGWPQWGYRPQAPRTLQDGDVIRAEVFCNFGGRHTQHQVLIAIGEVHQDLERAARVARAIYDAGIQGLRPGRRFGDVVDEMLKPMEGAGGWVFGPPVHGLNPLIALSSFPGNVEVDGIEHYPALSDHPTILADMKLVPGMCFALEPNYAFGRHLAYMGGTVMIGETEAIEFNPYTAQILRVAGTKH